LALKGNGSEVMSNTSNWTSSDTTAHLVLRTVRATAAGAYYSIQFALRNGLVGQEAPVVWAACTTAAGVAEIQAQRMAGAGGNGAPLLIGMPV